MKDRRVRLSLLKALVAAGALAFSIGAQAAYMASLAFHEPTGTVGPTDTIPIWVRLSLDPSSDPLVLNTDAGGTPPFGVPAENLPTNFGFSVYDPDTGAATYHTGGTYTGLQQVFLNTSFTCSGTFTSSCSPGAYQFDFNTTGPDTINFLPTFDNPVFALQPGQSRDYLFGTFTPAGGGPVAEGTYEFYVTSLSLNFYGTVQALENVLDEDGNPIPVLDEFGDPVYDEFGNPVYQTQLNTYDRTSYDFDLANTGCTAEPTADCPFSRQVVSAVPAPPAIWLFLTGMAGLAGRAVRRRR